MFDVRRIHGKMSTNNIDARFQLIHDEKYCHVFGNKQFFVEANSIKKKSDCHLGLDKFVKEYGAPDKMTYDGAHKQIGRKNKLNIELWEDLAGNNEIFHEEFARVITNEDIPEADDIFNPEEFDNFVNMELALDRHDDGPEFARVNKRLQEKYGRPIIIAADNPILDIRMYGVEYADGYKTVMTDNIISSNLFYQVDQDGQSLLLFNAIIDSRTDGTQIKVVDSVIHMSNGNKRRRDTTKVWEVSIQWKYGSSN